MDPRQEAFYTRRLAGRAGLSLVSNSIVIGCWIVFGVYWAASALMVKRTAERQSIPSMLAHRIPLGLAAFLMAYQNFPSALNWVLISRADWALVFAAALCLAGLVVTLWARWTLAGNW